MRIAIANDVAMAVEALRRVIAGVPGYRLAWVATDGAEAVERCRQDTPDLILMDLMMPVMDGVEATSRIMSQTPCAILIVTATLEGHSAKVFEALGAGALDAVQTPIFGGGQSDGVPTLKIKIETIGRLINGSSPRFNGQIETGVCGTIQPPSTEISVGTRSSSIGTVSMPSRHSEGAVSEDISWA